MPCGSAMTTRSITAAEKGHWQAVWPGPGPPAARGRRRGLRRGLLVGAAAEESKEARQASGGAREEQNRGAGGVEVRQILEEQSILEGSDHVPNVRHGEMLKLGKCSSCDGHNRHTNTYKFKPT